MVRPGSVLEVGQLVGLVSGLWQVCGYKQEETRITRCCSAAMIDDMQNL